MSVLHNTSSPHSLPAFIAEITGVRWLEAHLWPNGSRRCSNCSRARTAGASDESEEDVSYAVYNHPLPLTGEQELRVKLVLALLSALFVLIPFCYIPATAAVFIVRERATKAKHLQLVSGASPLVYWASSYVWDLLMYSLTSGGAFAVCVISGEEAYVGSSEQAVALLCLIALYGAAVLPHVYCLSFAFESHSTAQIGLIILNMVSGFVLVITHFVMSSVPRTVSTDAFLVHLYLLLPPFVFGDALIGLAKMWYANAMGGRAAHPTDWDVAGRAFVLLPCLCLGYSLLLMLLEHPRSVWSAARPFCRWVCGTADPSPTLSQRSRGALVFALATPLVAGALLGFWGSACAIALALVLVCYVLCWERRCA